MLNLKKSRLDGMWPVVLRAMPRGGASASIEAKQPEELVWTRPKAK